MISELLSSERIKIPLVGQGKREVLVELIDLVVATGKAEDAGRLLQVTMEREERMPTAMGKGVAIPRCQDDFVADLCLAMGVHPEGIEFEAHDGEPVQLFFLLAAPRREIETYTKALSHLLRLVNQDSLRDDLCRMSDPDEIIRLLEEEEQKLW